MLPASRRCAVAARSRGDDLVATAQPSHRVLALEVPGPWVGDVVAAAGLPQPAAGRLRAVAATSGTRVVLVRRPLRHPRTAGPRAWLLADIRTGGLRTGTWSAPEDLDAVDVAAPVPGGAPARPVVLVCTHARHDQCCAIDGRPVVAALVADGRVDVWEASHLGGDRFAANALVLPAGDQYGRLTADDVPALVDAALTGRVLTDHHRGRCGVPHPEQAAHTLALRALGLDRPADVVVEDVGVPAADGTFAATVRHGVHRHELDLVAGWTAPARLTCAGLADKPARTYALAGFRPRDAVSRPT